jgi:putative transcriptional regulator
MSNLFQETMAMPVQLKNDTLKGTFLIASLNQEFDWIEHTFVRTVVLILEHSADAGAVGVIINRPLGEKVKLYSSEALRKITEGIDLMGDTEKVSKIFFRGGSMKQDSLIFLHQLEDIIPDSVPIFHDLYAGGELDALRAHDTVMNSAEPILRFYLGHAGWNEGQLEGEIERGDWILCPGNSNLVFSPTPETVWQQALYTMGDKYRPLSFFPEDPIVN